MLTLEQATAILKKNVPSAKIIGSLLKDDKYLFLAPYGDKDEGYFDPFFSVDVNTKEFRDWSPQDYENPLEIINALTN